MPIAMLNDTLVEEFARLATTSDIDRFALMSRMTANPHEALAALDRIQDGMNNLRSIFHKAAENLSKVSPCR